MSKQSIEEDPKCSSPREDEHVMPVISGDSQKHLAEMTSRMSQHYFHKEFSELQKAESAVLTMLAERRAISREIYNDTGLEASLGNRIADRVAQIGGSWGFIIFFAIFIFAWCAVNTVILARRQAAFDPYPYTALNLVLSTLAAFQAPVIMMSQNRQAARDRLDASHDYEINLKADLEILDLHDKLDEFRNEQWQELVKVQQQQMEMLLALMKSRGCEAPAELLKAMAEQASETKKDL